MSKKLIEILPSLQSFKDKVIVNLTNMFNGAEWLNDATSYTKQETIYRLLILKYGDRLIRYDDENIFLNRFIFDLADLMPDIYAKQQVFIRNQLADFLSSVKDRAVIIDNETNNTRDSNSDSKLGNSSSPLNLVINDASEIINAPITSSNLSNVKLLENYKGNNQQVNYNFVSDLTRALNADYSLRLNEFMDLLSKHFVNIVGSYYKYPQCNNQTVKDEPYRFNNGFFVNEVDYLGTQNKEEINRFNEKLERLSDQISTKQSQLTAGDNIKIENNVISAVVPKTDLSNYYTKQEIDLSQSNQNILINQNTQRINDIVYELKKQGLLVYKGQYISGTKYFLGNTVSFEGKIYVCKVLETMNDPTNTNDWDVLAIKDIDLSDYYNKSQIDQMIRDINNQIKELNDSLVLKQDKLTFSDDFEVLNNEVELSDVFLSRINNLETQLQLLTKKVQDQEKIIQNNTTIINEQQQYINELKTKIKWDEGSTRLLFDENHYIKINGTNAYKYVAGINEPLASDTWVGNQLSNYFTKTDLTNYSTILKVRELRVGYNESEAYMRIYRYSSNQCIIDFKNGDVHNIIAPNDKRIKWSGGGWYFT